MKNNNFISLFEKYVEEIFVITRGSKYNEEGIKFITIYEEQIISMKNQFKDILEGFHVDYGYISKEMICFAIMELFDRLKPIRNLEGCLELSDRIKNELNLKI